MRLAVGSAAILVLWLGVLPRIADQPPVQRHIEFLEQRHIDPSAMFYTELEPMAELRSRVARIRRDHPAPFWEAELGPGSAQGQRWGRLHLFLPGDPAQKAQSGGAEDKGDVHD